MKISLKDKAIAEISKSDPKLFSLIEKIGDLEIELRGDYFTSLVKSIISQQLSVKAATTIYQRFAHLLDNKITPDSISDVTDDQLRSVGISRPKIIYLRDLTKKVLIEEIKLENVALKSNGEIIETLTKVKGIGNWTGAMFLIFTLGRMDVLPLDDVGLQRAVKWLYHIDHEENLRAVLQEKARNWCGHYTIASLYLWEVINRDLLKEEKE